jgi:hypothetical protein
MRIALAVLVVLVSLPCVAQGQTPKPLNLVMPNGLGRIVVPSSAEIEWKTVNLYDNGTRPVFQGEDKANGLAISYVLFPNSTGSDTPGICRDDVLNAAMRSLSPVPGFTDIKQVKKGEHPPVHNNNFATASFFLASMGDAKVEEQNVFGVSASRTACAEIHVSKTGYKATDEATLNQHLDTFVFDPAYLPTTEDYFRLASVFYRVTKAYDSAAFYYQRALDTLPADAPLNYRRVLIDQLSMSYGISGQLKLSRTVNEAAIRTDPDYPLYYYMVACADAEQGRAVEAKVHLQQAFDRKANTIPGEHLPDPSTDDSILKLKKNKDFWSFVGTLR